mmetsp:Transcript_25181/g.63924  ORF Transcript_25181/g.63924 Transcript_25181/m.63924 type:complete len:586 (-) Transcript_25181:237-1994(-)
MPPAGSQVVGAFDTDEDDDLPGESRTFLDPSQEAAQAVEARVVEVIEHIPGCAKVIQMIRDLPLNLGARPVPILAGGVGFLLLISLSGLLRLGAGAAPKVSAAVSDDSALALIGESVDMVPDLPDLPPAAADGMCSPGWYHGGATGECTVCSGGFTRRRRADKCTPCVAGQFDFGNLDDCFESSYWASYDGVDCGGQEMKGEVYGNFADAKARCVELGPVCAAITDPQCDNSTGKMGQKVYLCDGALISQASDLSGNPNSCTRVKEKFEECSLKLTKERCRLPRCQWEQKCEEVFEVGMAAPAAGAIPAPGGKRARETGPRCQGAGLLIKSSSSCKVASTTLGMKWVGEISKLNRQPGCFIEKNYIMGFNVIPDGAVADVMTGINALPMCFKARKCPLAWTNWKKACYRTYPDQVPWLMAEQECLAQGAHLASIEDDAEARFVSQQLGGDWAWVGHNLSGSSMQWSDGTNPGFLLAATPWAMGGVSKSGDCGLLGPQGQLGDNECSAKLRFACKISKAIMRQAKPKPKRPRDGGRRLMGLSEPGEQEFVANLEEAHEEEWNRHLELNEAEGPFHTFYAGTNSIRR